MSDITHYYGDDCDPPHVEGPSNLSASSHWLAERVMASQSVREAGMTDAQVVAVLRGMADFTLWLTAFPGSSPTDGPALEAARFCHRIADDILDRRHT